MSDACGVTRYPPFRGYCINLRLCIDYNFERKSTGNHQTSEIQMEVTLQLHICLMK